jgi:hypothetical protein
MGSKEKADVFLLNLGNKIYFTAADKQSSEMIADSIGKHTIKKRTYGRSLGKSNTSWTEQDEHLIKPHVLRALPSTPPSSNIASDSSGASSCRHRHLPSQRLYPPNFASAVDKPLKRPPDSRLFESVSNPSKYGWGKHPMTSAWFSNLDFS